MIIVKNRKAYYEYEVLDKYTAGIQLQGSEVKSIRNSKVSVAEAYCYFKGDELFVKSMNVAEYQQSGRYDNHNPIRERKLLLKKKELLKLKSGLQEKGLTIIPLSLFLNERGKIKLEIGLCKGKKLYDKRNSIKEKDQKRDLERNL
jgi:SsrA-binding protein|tara:strand:+ start:2513 stop:2950 length:438 start_codon:yes stop_codon:yes gene_type:complete